MAYVMQMNELGNGEKLRGLCRESFDPVFVAADGQEELVVLNMSAYRNLYAKLQIYERLEEGERDVAAGRESDAFEMLDKVAGGVGV